MNRKRILVSMVAVGVMLGCSTFAYADETSLDTTNNVVETTEVESSEVESISDEKAVELASEAMKFYLNRDTSGFERTRVYRCSSYNGLQPDTVNILFESGENDYRDNAVILNAHTGEVLRVSREGRTGIFQGEVNKEKIKESIINVLAKAGLKPDEDTNWDKIFVCHDGGDANMFLYVNGRKVVEVVIDLDDFSVVTLNKVYELHAGENFGEI